MNNFLLRQYGALIKRELLEHRNLFLGGPILVAILLLAALLWVINFGAQDVIVVLLTQAGEITEGMRGSALAPLLMPMAVPFVITLFIGLLAYLINTLYQDRRDMSILFWQSMPVANINTVMSKVITAGFIAPIFMVAVLVVLMLVCAFSITVLAAINDVDSVGLGQMLVAILNCALLVYMTVVLAGLWLLPTLGWLLLFSAFAKSQPLMWAIVTFILIAILEGLVFDTQYLADWSESRSGFYSYLVLQPSDFFDRLFSYDMLFGIFLGSLIITGATYMRRFAD
ncbi:MAG: hypothetical protein WD772_05245 [Pseudohongiellaceae bacterium]